VQEIDVKEIPLEALLLPTVPVVEDEDRDVVRAGLWVFVRHAVGEVGMMPTRAWRFTTEYELDLTLAQLTGAFG
jgi:hypothetical protein